MSTKSPLALRIIAVGGGAVLALGASAGVATAQTGSLESGFGLDIDSVLIPAGELSPGPGSLDEAVSPASSGAEAGSPDARGERQRALPPPSGSSAAGDGSAVAGTGSLDPIQPGLGVGIATGPGAPAPGALGSGFGDLDRPGAGADTAPGAALTVLTTMAGGLGESGPGPAQLPQLPPPR